MRSSTTGDRPEQRLDRALSARHPDPPRRGGAGPPTAARGQAPPGDHVRAWVVDDSGSPDDPDPPAVTRSISTRAALFAACVAVVALLVVLPRVLSSEPELQPVPPRPVPTPSVAEAVTVSAPTSSATPNGGAILVHVVGQVRRPGVVRLAAGARVQDAVRAAGGATRRADLAAVNLARAAVDGEQVFVPKPGEKAPAGSGPAGSGTSGPAVSGGQVDLNTADETQLDALPGVGPVIAGRIVAWRDEHGRFSSVDELTEVSGIGDATLERLRPLVRT
jgi:competence protein ComEA